MPEPVVQRARRRQPLRATPPTRPVTPIAPAWQPPPTEYYSPPAPHAAITVNPREAMADAKAAKARAKALRPFYRKKRFWILGIVVVVIGAAIAGSGSEDQQPNTLVPAATQERYTIGQTAHTGDFDVTLHTVQDPFVPGNSFETPPDGQRFVAVELTATNTGDEQEVLSTLAGAEVFDSATRPWSIAFAGLELPRLDGFVAVGESRRGWIVFAVALDSTGLELRIKGEFTSTGSVFQLTAP